MRKRVAEAVEDVFGFEIPERLELEPFGDVVFELLDFGFNKLEGFFKGIIGETCELGVAFVNKVRRKAVGVHVRGKRRSAR